MSESKTNWIAALRDSFVSAERRREPRRYVKLPITVRLRSGETHPGFSRDLCRFGMGAVISTPLKTGEEVWITFEYPLTTGAVAQVTQQAIVRQCLGFRYGLQFTVPLDVDDEGRRL